MGNRNIIYILVIILVSSLLCILVIQKLQIDLLQKNIAIKNTEIVNLTEDKNQIKSLPVFTPIIEDVIGLSSPSYTIIKNNEPVITFNADNALPIASLTKIVTAVVAIENYNLDLKVRIPEECTLIDNSYTKTNFASGETFFLEDLLTATLVSSSADAACAIESLEPHGEFISKMNNLATKLELQNTKFDNTIGIDSDGNYSTVNDLIAVIRYSKQSETLIKLASTETSIIQAINTGSQYKIETTNDLLVKIPGVTGFKTGYTTEAGECLILSYQNKLNNFVFIVLGSDDRFLDTKKMINYVQSTYN